MPIALAPSPKTEPSSEGMMPMLGLISSTQPIASSSGGVAIGIKMPARKRSRPGMSVRSTSQASTAASAMPKAVLPAAKISVSATRR
jgi:hypothetical protein